MSICIRKTFGTIYSYAPAKGQTLPRDRRGAVYLQGDGKNLYFQGVQQARRQQQNGAGE